MTWRIRSPVALAGVCALMAIAGCAPSVPTARPENKPPATIESPFEGAAVLPPADMTDDGPGSLLDVKPINGVSDFDQVNAVAVRVVYRSTDSKGAGTGASGVVVVPPGKPPRGGWPILSVGHTVTGTQNQCAPSIAQDLGGYSAVIGQLVDRGYVVTMTDYQGLGLPVFQHPFLDSVTLGNNMIDAVRAARRVVPSTSNQWAAFGTGQGGMAAWGAAERAATYGAGLQLVGAVALGPLADLTGLADAAENGTLNVEQYRLYALVLASLADSLDYHINLDDYRSDAAKANWDALTNCALADPAEGARALAQLGPGDFKPKTSDAAAQLRRILQGLALPGPSAVSAPLLVAYATSDPQLPSDWIEQAVRNACARGDSVDVIKRVGTVNALDQEVFYDSLAWVQARLDGQRVTNICVGV